MSIKKEDAFIPCICGGQFRATRWCKCPNQVVYWKCDQCGFEIKSAPVDHDHK